MESGCVIEQGNHEELIEHDGVYKKFVQIQAKQSSPIHMDRKETVF